MKKKKNNIDLFGLISIKYYYYLPIKPNIDELSV